MNILDRDELAQQGAAAMPQLSASEREERFVAIRARRIESLLAELRQLLLGENLPTDGSSGVSGQNLNHFPPLPLDAVDRLKQGAVGEVLGLEETVTDAHARKVMARSWTHHYGPVAMR